MSKSSNLVIILLNDDYSKFMTLNFINEMRDGDFTYILKTYNTFDDVKSEYKFIKETPVVFLAPDVLGDKLNKYPFVYFKNSSKVIGALLIQKIKGLKELKKKPKVGKLERIDLGCMYSGKSSELIRYLTINADLGFKTLYVNNVLDVRETENGGEMHTTHSSSGKMSKKIDTIKAKYLKSVDVSGYDVIGVDEFQFYSDESTSDVVRDWVLNKGKRVSVSSLDGDFNIKKFGQVFDLIPLCESGGLRKLTGAKCITCLKKGKIIQASYTKKITNVKEDDIIDIGGKDKYIAVCLKCHRE